MNLSVDEIAALESGAIRVGIFFRMETDPVIRLWLGFGDIKPGTNALDTDGQTYAGMGVIKEVPSLKHLINGRADRVDFTVSGVSGELLEIASGGDAQQIKGKRVSVGFAIMSPGWGLLGSIKWVANLTADYLAIKQGTSEDPKAPIVRTVTLSCGSLMTARRRPTYSYFTHQDQVARYPGDMFCERTPAYANGFNKTWPTFPDP